MTEIPGWLSTEIRTGNLYVSELFVVRGVLCRQSAARQKCGCRQGCDEIKSSHILDSLVFLDMRAVNYRANAVIAECLPA